jgi:hypothetical protein
LADHKALARGQAGSRTSFDRVRHGVPCGLHLASRLFGRTSLRARSSLRTRLYEQSAQKWNLHVWTNPMPVFLLAHCLERKTGSTFFADAPAGSAQCAVSLRRSLAPQRDRIVVPLLQSARVGSAGSRDSSQHRRAVDSAQSRLPPTFCAVSWYLVSFGSRRRIRKPGRRSRVQAPYKGTASLCLMMQTARLAAAAPQRGSRDIRQKLQAATPDVTNAAFFDPSDASRARRGSMFLDMSAVSRQGALPRV